MDEEKKVVRYGDLKPGEAFRWVNGHGELRLKIEGGNIDPRTGTKWGDEMDIDKQVIPVKAKILWCREDGE